MGSIKTLSMRILLVAVVSVFSFSVCAQRFPTVRRYESRVWLPGNGDSTYTNPVLNADYSDPDAIRVGNDFYLVSSSFEDIPGLPILQSGDLVHWHIIGHALLRQPPYDYYSRPRHGNGVWAPAIRFHNGMFYIYYPDPDFGIYMVKAKKAAGPWTEPVLIAAGRGLIDPCPFWDDDGQVYLVHAFAGSRAGIKSVIVLNRMNKAGTAITNDGRMVYDGHEKDPTIEGPKLYKRNGYYYIFAPAGGVPGGWQLALRSQHIYGPYERRVVMDQGGSATNGPHQGAWVTTPTGEDWFLHFQDKGPYGRVVHLEPMKWVNNWPVIGIDKDGDGKGEPVQRYKMPDMGGLPRTYGEPVESDEFNRPDIGIGPQWQWMANPKPTWAFVYNGALKLYSDQWPDSARNLWEAPNVLLQKFPADSFTVTTKLTFIPNTHIENEKAGLTVMGFSYANIAVKSKKDGLWLVYTICKDADKGKPEQEQMLTKLEGATVYLRVKVEAGAKCRFGYSVDGKAFTAAGDVFQAEVGRWIGAKMGLFCTRETPTNDSGSADFDWFRMEK
jgi:beta-xylosidase